MNRQPLAEQMRPTTLDDVLGQSHLLDDGEILRQIVINKQPVSLILWGPPGTGKTTLARIIAREVEAEFIELSAVTANKKDVTTTIDHARQNWNLGLRTVLFVDEIHRFNKAQQDAFLPHVESGLITLIGATTENPSFEVITPLLSRARVLTLQPISKPHMLKILQRAAKYLDIATQITDEAIDYIAELSGGDARVALGNIELAAQLARGKAITKEIATTAAQKKLPGYDKQGDAHYDTISAFIKSMRGSDTTATLYYLARMLAAGEDPVFIARRMMIFASEDIGLAGNGALSLTVATSQAVERIGMPEAKYVLFHCAAALAKSKKSRETTDAMNQAFVLADRFAHSPVPIHLRNASTKLMQDLGYNKGYEWKADFRHKDGFLPPDVANHLTTKPPTL